VDLRQLRTFRAVAELGSLSKAADSLHIAQPALSRQIKLLEQEVRVELFVRNGRGMDLTPAGKLLLDRTEGVLRLLEQVRDDLQSFSGIPSGRVVLGLVPTVSTVLAARIARTVINELPSVSLCIVESYSGHLIDWLHRHEMDLAIVYASSDELHVAAEPLGKDQLVAIGAKGSGLAKRQTVEFSWLVEQSLALPSQSHGLRAIIAKAAEAKGVDLKIVIEADSFRVLTQIAELGLGYAILPLSSVRAELEQGRLETASVTNPALVRNLIVARPLDTQASIATSAVAEAIRNEVRKAAGDSPGAIAEKSIAGHLRNRPTGGCA
jgi:LysR family transcriptional regulator, nitrogen assimilation regulatory protein